MKLAIREGGGLPSVEKARALLQECGATGEVKKIRAIAQAIATMERGKEIGLDAADIILWADRRIGELTREAPTLANDGTRGNQASPARGPAKSVALSEAGISKQRASECERVAGLDDGEVRQYAAAKRKAKEPVSTREAAKLATIPKLERKNVLATLADVPSVSKAIREAAPAPAPKATKAAAWDRDSLLRDVRFQLDEWEEEWKRHEPDCTDLVSELRAWTIIMEKSNADRISNG